VRGLASGQVVTARRFADAQIDNVHGRLESLHDGTNESASSVGLNIGFGRDDPSRDPRYALSTALGEGALFEQDEIHRLLDQALWADRETGPGLEPAPATLTSGTTRAGRLGLWAAGMVDWGRDESAGFRDRRFRAQGLTLGVDSRLGDRAAAGVAVGFGRDPTRIGDHGSSTQGEAPPGTPLGGRAAGGRRHGRGPVGPCAVPSR